MVDNGWMDCEVEEPCSVDNQQLCDGESGEMLSVHICNHIGVSAHKISN